MSGEEMLNTARGLPRGAVFHRCALQVNPHHYAGTYRGRPAPDDADGYARSIVAKACELGVKVLAITDHNDVGGVDAFRRAASSRGIHVFPGFELTSSEGVHVLCVYPPETTSETLGRYLGAFGITRPQPSSDPCKQSFSEVLACVRGQGGIAVAAHVTNENGLFEVLEGKPRIKAWRSDDLLAIQIPGTVEDLPREVRQIVENRNADYRREHPAGDRLAVAVVNAKDVASPDDLADPPATTLIKMSVVGIEGLRQAFLDPESRIRLNPQDEEPEYSELITLAWEGGFLDGTAIHFNPNLNVLVGGRGTGKSTVVESIRAVLGLDPVGDDARKAHEGIVRQVLRSGTKISLLLRSHRPSPSEYRIERTIPNPPVVRDAQGEISNLLPSDVLPGVEVYGQHEIAEVAKSPEKRTRLLGRFVERDENLPRRKASMRGELEKNRRSLTETRAELARIEERLAALPGLEETLERFREAGIEERLKDKSLLVREERILALLPERLASFHDCLGTLREELPIDRAFLSSRALEELPGGDVLSRAEAVLEALEDELHRVVQDLEGALTRAEEGIEEVRNAWEIRRQEVEAAYERILRELQASRVDGEEFISLRRQVEELQPLRERRDRERRLERDLTTHRTTLLAEWEDLKAEEFRGLERAAKRVNRRLRNRVEVQVTRAANREPLFSLLRESVPGRLSEALTALGSAKDLALPQLVHACRTGASALVETYAMPPAQAQHLAEADPHVHLRIEELDLPPVTAIRLNTAPAGEAATWQDLEEVSTGQKATAVLLLLLLESEAPLVVDQPEDDLDNRFITEEVVPRMREEKQRRQFVFSTHNANIPVLGDAELILGLSASGEAERGQARIAPEHRGAIDSNPVRELVEEILEGGKAAFELRRRKYGF